ncbi:O-antigen ligase family protein [Protaetiibacter mangrovi]|uniref:O-antigen ligase family protein n=1 Tax=Protaetiibacter mangrovi TaxID=2970926 RepID=A0ABT1ZFJ1_9MICO|nr:O-antigen ligase family protein [Protaetiibacter mangrovi]MCS0499459.1 O-antigen ligase family protein [Protaetiibacter mangrovi]TPX04231.1 O-antigen ligase family protein [Schumannella luteola]
MRAATSYQRALATLSFGVLAAGDFWRYLLSWWGWGALAGVVVVLSILELVRARVDVRRLPSFLLLFLAFAAVSIAWSAYPGASALGVALTLATTAVAVFLATCLSWEEVLETFSDTLRWILGLSLLFEFVVAAFIRRPVLPLWVDYSDLEKIPAAFYWSRDLLFEGGRIQGIVGNANILGMLALLALIVFLLRLAARKGSPIWGWFWVVVAVANLALTRSSTVVVAAVVVLLVAAFLWVVRRTTGTARLAVFASGVVVAIGGLTAAFLAREPLLALLGKSSDLTNRLDIWETVGALAAQRPVVGWGWVSYWVPWVPPFDDLVVIKGVTYLQAHNAWLDVFLQLGAIGVAIFGLVVLGALVRSWGMAAEVTRIRYSAAELRWPETTAPLLLLVALLVQSLAESRLIIELGFALLVIIAVKTGWSDPERAEGVEA